MRNTNASDLLILNKFRNLNSSAVDIAKQFHTSDMHVLNVFDRYIQMERLPLTDAISVDEVYLDMDKSCKYALVIQDFYTGDQTDIIRSRLDKVTEPYFSDIPLKAFRALLSNCHFHLVTFDSKTCDVFLSNLKIHLSIYLLRILFLNEVVF